MKIFAAIIISLFASAAYADQYQCYGVGHTVDGGFRTTVNLKIETGETEHGLYLRQEGDLSFGAPSMTQISNGRVRIMQTLGWRMTHLPATLDFVQVISEAADGESSVIEFRNPAISEGPMFLEIDNVEGDASLFFSSPSGVSKVECKI